MNQPGQLMPEMSDDFVASISDRYIELYERIVGESFVKADDVDIVSRIKSNVTKCLEEISK